MTIGLISPVWLPRWGGAEQYHHRLALEMIRAGLPLKVLCATAAQDGRDNGSVPVERHVPRGNFFNLGWTTSLDNELTDPLREIAKHYAFFDYAVAWCRQNAIRLVLLGSPLQSPHMHHARELSLRLKEIGVSVGLIHHDLSPALHRELNAAYRQGTGSWEGAAQQVLRQLRQSLEQDGPHHAALASGSPMFFEPDFIIANSQWTARFSDPAGLTPSFVLHPLVDAAHWTAEPARALSPVDVLMINPQSRKGPGIMKTVMARAPAWARFRVLKGGWGEAFKVFMPQIVDLPAMREQRVELTAYVDDMRAAYRAAGLLLFPSIAEGYGLAPVEAMLCGTPVVSSSYPAVLEAVGEGALCLCPQKDSPRKWLAAIEQVLGDRPHWQSRARARARELVARQQEEWQAFLRFIAERARTSRPVRG